jgi:hypothetical protein
METTDPQAELGTCSFCGAIVAAQDVIVEYERQNGAPGIWAECPDCSEIVDPKS